MAAPRYTIEHMNGVYRVYRLGPFITGLKSFKTRRGAEEFARRQRAKDKVKS